jgi:phosphoesterase RecJ-like protein
MAADSGYFSQGNTSARLVQLAGWQVDNGAVPADIALACNLRTLPRMRLQASLMSQVEALFGGRVLLVQVSQQQLSDFNCTSTDLEGLVDQFTFVQGELISVLLRQMENNMVKVSMRSKKNIDISKLAINFDGGGHKNAAGFKMAGSFDFVRSQLLPQISSLIEEVHEA